MKKILEFINSLKGKCTDLWLGSDKKTHAVVCFIAAFVIEEKFAEGLALGKEMGDMRAVGNHWCWKDLAWDNVGILCGTLLRIAVSSLVSGRFAWFWWS